MALVRIKVFTLFWTEKSLQNFPNFSTLHFLQFLFFGLEWIYKNVVIGSSWFIYCCCSFCSWVFPQIWLFSLFLVVFLEIKILNAPCASNYDVRKASSCTTSTTSYTVSIITMIIIKIWYEFALANKRIRNISIIIIFTNRIKEFFK